MRGGEAIIESLKRMGVNTIFGYPGGQTIPFYDMLYDADMDHILVRHEQCAAHAADGFARASGKVGVCLATSGPGATNLVTGIATAYMDSSPIIAITGQVPTHLIGNDAFQEADIIGITMPITKHSFQPKDPNLIPSIVKTSFEIAESGRPGPVLIDVPKEIQEGELDSFDDSLISTPGYNPTLKGNIKQVRKARDLIRESKKPIILAGAGVILANASQELKELSYLINAPVMTSLLGKGAIDETDDMALGMLGMHGRKVANDSINESDLIIAVGIRFSDRATGRLDSFAPNSKIIHIDIDPAEIGKNVDVDLPIVGDAKNVLSSLNNVLKDYESNEDAKKWVKLLIERKKECFPRVTYDDIPLKPQSVIREISEVLTPDSILTTDVGQNQMISARYFKEIFYLLWKYSIYHIHFFLKFNGRIRENLVKLRYFLKNLTCFLYSFFWDTYFIQDTCISDCCHWAVNLTFTCLCFHLSHLLLPKTGHKCSALCLPRSSQRMP